MDAELLGFGDEVVAVLQRAVVVGERLVEERWRLSGQDLSRVLPLLDRCRAVMAGGVFAVAWEAEQRGEVAASQAGSTGQWVAERCPGLEPGEAGLVGKAVRRLGPARFAPVREAVERGELSVGAGMTVRAEFDAMTGQLAQGAAEAVIDGLVDMGCRAGRAGVRALRPALLARYGLGERLQEQDDRAVGGSCLSGGRCLGGGLWEYRLRLSADHRAAVEAAIGPLSAPHPCTHDGHDATDPGGEAGQGGQAGQCRCGEVPCAGRDTRSVEQRRGQALVEVCRRATALSPAATPSGVKAAVFVTIRWEDLREATGGGTVFAGVDGGTVVGPATVRRMACDAGIVPVVLGSRGEVLDLGQTVRLFTAAQHKALWLRDRHCTFPGCTTPAHWCDAHHVRHWADAGATDLGNAALLCGRHHTIVHRDRLTATVSGDTVTWNRTPGSYDHASDGHGDGDGDGDGEGEGESHRDGKDHRDGKGDGDPPPRR